MGCCSSKKNRDIRQVASISTETKPLFYQDAMNDTDHKEAQNTTTVAGLNCIRSYNMLLSGYARNLLHSNEHLNSIIHLIKTYFYSHYIITPLQSHLVGNFQQLFSLSYDIKHPNAIYLNNNHIHVKSAQKEHLMSNTDVINFTKINYKKMGIKGKCDVISSGLCNTETFLTTIYTKNDDVKQLICYTDTQQIQQSSQMEGNRMKFYPLINKPYMNDGDKIVDIRCGYEYCLFLTQKGAVWARGKNDYGQIGKGEAVANCTEMTEIEYNQFDINSAPIITSIRCGYDYNMMIDNKNQLWVFGNTLYGQLAVQGKVVWKATKHPYFTNNDGVNNINIKHISCGVRQSLCIDKKGKCYLFGYDASDDMNIPYLFQSSDKKFKRTVIRNGECGKNDTFLLTNRNEVISFDSNVNGCILCKEKVMRINSDDYISRIIVSSECTLVVIDKVKTRMDKITKDMINIVGSLDNK